MSGGTGPRVETDGRYVTRCGIPGLADRAGEVFDRGAGPLDLYVTMGYI